ncbi:MAG: PASTA domain-containing protein [Chloroflexi bacterium]|nr:PASTA domain-containing protein [Chloroflexota bacterium]
MAIEKPNLKEAQPGAPITADDWNAMIRALKELRATLQDLRTRTPAGILVTVRDRDTQTILPPEAIHAVYAVSVETNTLMQPGQRASGGDQAYLIPIDTPGEYEVTVEPTPQSGYQIQTQRVTVSDDIALVEFLLWEQPRAPEVPMVFGKTLREARAILEAAGVPVQRMLDAHGQEIDPETWEADYGNRLVVSTEPGAGMTIAGGEAVDILVAGRVEPTERKPVLVGQIPVARPTRLALSPDGSLLYVLSQGAASGGSTGITVIDTRRRRVITTIDTGSTPLLNIVFHPSQARAYASVILPEFTMVSKIGSAVEWRPVETGIIDWSGVTIGRSSVEGGRDASIELDSGSLMESTSPGIGGTTGFYELASPISSGAFSEIIAEEASVGFASGVAGLAAAKLAGALGRGVQARGNQGAVAIIDTARHRAIPGALIATAVCYGLDITADGRFLYGTAPTQGRAIRIDLAKNATTKVLSRGAPVFVDVVGTDAYITDVSRHLLLHIPADGDIRSFQAGTSPQELAVSPDGRFAYVINFNLQTGSLVRVDLRGDPKAEPKTIPGVAPRVATQDGFLLSGIAITSDGVRVCVAIDEGLAVVHAGTLAVQTVQLGGAPAGVVVEPRRPDGSGGKYAYVANFADNVVQIIDLTGEDEPFVRTTFTGAVFADRLAELMTVPGINEHLAERLVLSGVASVNELASADATLVASALGVNATQATVLISRAGRLALR